jgi:hypothetical protein
VFDEDRYFEPATENLPVVFNDRKIGLKPSVKYIGMIRIFGETEDTGEIPRRTF